MRIGFVIPWFADDIPGGAEAAVRGITSHLAAAGVDVEVLTTCAEKFLSDWSCNHYPQGEDVAAGVTVRRFPVKKRDAGAFDKVNHKLIKGASLSLEEEDVFLEEMINSPDLYDYLREHKEMYSLYVFIPYMFGTTYFGCQICPERSVVIPCLHDESYAYMERFKEVFPKVRGMIFNAKAEMEFAGQLYDLTKVEQAVIGIGVDTGISGDPAVFKEKYGISEPFILYAGRKDEGKNVGILVQYFKAYKKRNPGSLKLVFIGGGDMDVSGSGNDDILDLGYVPVQDKYDAYSASLFLCQPSVNESFSLVVMESWLCHRPVLVHADCDVTKEFVLDSQGGLYFSDYKEFAGCLDYFISNEEQAIKMGDNGRNYVIGNFTWDSIIGKYIDYFKRLCV